MEVRAGEKPGEAWEHREMAGATPGGGAGQGRLDRRRPGECSEQPRRGAGPGEARGESGGEGRPPSVAPPSDRQRSLRQTVSISMYHMRLQLNRYKIINLGDI